MKRIFYIGSLNETSNSYRRYLALERMEYLVEGLNIEPFLYDNRLARLHHFFNVGLSIDKLNDAAIQIYRQYSPDVIIVDNRSFLKTKFFREINGKVPVVNVLTDDPFGKNNLGWQLHKKTAQFFDYIFVQRACNIDEFKRLGCDRVEMLDRSFDPILHKPLKKDNLPLQAEVGFVGSYADYRSKSIAQLIRHGFDVKIWGNGWNRSNEWGIIKKNYMGPAVYLDKYAALVNSIEIHLHYLRKENRDEQDSRSFEIPGCGKFMLAERTTKHLELFHEGVEADYFSSQEELESKLYHYLKNKELIKSIELNARNRALASRYDHDSRMAFVINRVR